MHVLFCVSLYFLIIAAGTVPYMLVHGYWLSAVLLLGSVAASGWAVQRAWRNA